MIMAFGKLDHRPRIGQGAIISLFRPYWAYENGILCSIRDRDIKAARLKLLITLIVTLATMGGGAGASMGSKMAKGASKSAGAASSGVVIGSKVPVIGFGYGLIP